MTDVSKITRARSALIQSTRFFGALALRLVPTASTSVESLATDGKDLLFNQTWVDVQPMPIVTGVCAKMVTHLTLLHHTRRRERDQALWQRCCDYAVNPIVVDAGFELPDGYLDNPDYHGKSAEDIYQIEKALQDARNEQDAQQGGSNGVTAPDGGNGTQSQSDAAKPASDENSAQKIDANALMPDPGNAGQILDAKTEDGNVPSPAELSQLESEQTRAVQQATTLAANAGQGSDLQKMLLADLKQAKHDWKDELKRFVLARAKDDFSWRRPNRRLVSQGYYLPSLSSSKLGTLVVAVDMSGSTKSWQQEFLEHIKTMHEDVRPEKLIMLYCTDRISGVDEFDADDDFKPQPRGSGGTSFLPPFAWVRDNDIEPAALIYLTDLIGEVPDVPPDYPVIWACSTKRRAPWGEVVRLRR